MKTLADLQTGDILYRISSLYYRVEIYKITQITKDECYTNFDMVGILGYNFSMHIKVYNTCRNTVIKRYGTFYSDELIFKIIYETIERS